MPLSKLVLLRLDSCHILGSHKGWFLQKRACHMLTSSKAVSSTVAPAMRALKALPDKPWSASNANKRKSSHSAVLLRSHLGMARWCFLVLGLARLCVVYFAMPVPEETMLSPSNPLFTGSGLVISNVFFWFLVVSCFVFGFAFALLLLLLLWVSWFGCFIG